MAKCSECGYLTLRNVETLALEEASDRYRQDACRTTKTNRYLHEDSPLCFVRAICFRSLLGDDTSVPNLVSVINQERACDHWIEWMQGFTPKEHAEMLQHEALLEYQRRHDREEREWRERQAERDRLWRKQDRWSALSMLLVAAASGVIGAVATLIAAGKLPWQ